MQTPAAKTALFLALGLILVLMTIYVIGFLGLLTGIPVNRFEFPLALLAAFGAFYACTRTLLSARSRTRITGIILGIILLSGILSGLILDTSWDGQWYHLSAISRIADGWNPVRQPFYPIGKYDTLSAVWIFHYPKYSWISGAVIYKCTGRIETGKLINHLIAWATFFSAYYVLSSFIRKNGWRLLMAFLLAFNPVLITQLFSDYVDGIMGNLLLLVLLQLLSMEIKEPAEPAASVPAASVPVRIKWIILGCCLIMASNLKFTGLVLSGVMIFFFSAYWLLRRYSLKAMTRKVALFTLIYILAFFFFGYNPYWTNYRAKHSPFYPVNDPKVYALVVHSIPPLMKATSNTVKKMGLSLLSECNNDQNAATFHGKNPFVVHKSEVMLFSTTDVRMSGFGPLFQLVMWLSLPLLAWSLLYRRQQPFFLLVSITLLTIIGLTVLFPESWWARYFPLFYLFPFLVILLSITPPERLTLVPAKPLPLLSVVILGVLTLNFLLIGGANIAANIVKTRLIRQEMASMKRSATPVKIDFNGSYFQATRRRLTEAGVKFIETDTLTGNIKELHTLYKLEGFGPKYSTD